MDNKRPRLTLASLKVLRVFLENPNQQLAGADVQKLSGVYTGTLYPILLRFDAAGWLDSEWEEIDPKEAGVLENGLPADPDRVCSCEQSVSFSWE